MKEEWKDILDFPGYQVSNLGRVRTHNKVSYAKVLADKDKEINDLQEENMALECKIMSLEEELDSLKTDPIDPYDEYIDRGCFG